ncbi:hypothetical protein CYMTET_55727 [Cymbomonas tetramitiformis]|uniref:Uncharacterized protein n=1 Tax=Cymbomonas tetramitiformis TaxID=36881 RepID=A0AAE0BCC0_9CHLO|nr:hypothetical protein CYMTET_55727 [Cymbomonas tetramitiformis]
MTQGTRTPGNALARRTRTEVAENAGVVAAQNTEIQVGTRIFKPGRGNSGGHKGQVQSIKKGVTVYHVLYEDGDEEDLDASQLLHVLFQRCPDDHDSYTETFFEAVRTPTIGDKISKRFGAIYSRGTITSSYVEAEIFWVRWNDKKLEDFDRETIQQYLLPTDSRGILVEIIDKDEDKEERRGWTPTPPSDDFIKTPTYVPGTAYRTESGEPGFIHLLGTDASPIEFEKLYVPRSIYESIAAQATIYARQGIKKKLDARLKITAVEFCFLNLDPTADSFGKRDHTVKWASISDDEKDELIAFWRSKLDAPDVKFLPEHIIAWRMCTLVAYGLHGIKYDIRQCWSNSLLFQIPILKGFITRDLFKCIQTYVHFEDNEQNAVDVSDCSFKYRRICQQLKVILQKNKQLSQDYDIDEGTLDTSSRKVRNSTRKRHKPSENMGVTINKLCDKSGYCWNWEEEHTEGDDSTAGIWRRLAQPAIDQGYRGLIGTVDSRFLGLEIVETLKDLADFRTCSTLDSKRAGMPSAEITALDNDLTWGEYSFLYRNGMEIACWADHNVVHVLQNAFPPGWRGHVIRTDMQQKSSQVWMEVPYSLQHYNQEMAGTDTNDQRMKNNSSTKGRKYVRQPTKMVLYALNLNTNGGHLQYQEEHCGETCSSAFPKSDYLADVVLAYMKESIASGVSLRTYGKHHLEG